MRYKKTELAIVTEIEIVTEIVSEIENGIGVETMT